MAKCKHGAYPTVVGEHSKSELRAIEKHRKARKCSAYVFAHPGTVLGIVWVLCCEKHGRVA